MNRVGRASLMLCLGGVIARLLWSGGFGWFVQQHMKWPLIAAAIALLGFGFYEIIAVSRRSREDPEAGRIFAGPSVGWLLALPLLVLISVAPTGLGAAAAGRVEAFTPTETSSGFAPLEPAPDPIEMRVYDFLNRAVWDESRSLDGVTVRLEGLVVNDPAVPDGFRLTRFMVSCCAADGVPLQVIVHHDGPPLADDTWVIADVVWRSPEVPYDETTGPRPVEADASSVVVVPDPPDDPYESPY